MQVNNLNSGSTYNPYTYISHNSHEMLEPIHTQQHSAT